MMLRKSPVGGPEAEEIQDSHGTLTFPGTWRIALKEIRVSGK